MSHIFTAPAPYLLSLARTFFKGLDILGFEVKQVASEACVSISMKLQRFLCGFEGSGSDPTLNSYRLMWRSADQLISALNSELQHIPYSKVPIRISIDIKT